jgi:hypothetical protein
MILGFGGLAALLAILPDARPQEAPGGPALTSAAPAPAASDGVEVQARGPVHEAYAESVAGDPQAAAPVPKAPPQPIEEMPPDQKPEGANVQWIPGYWSWDGERTDYMWVSGFWRAPPPGRAWVPGHWKQGESGYLWVSGFWGPTEQTDVSYLPPPPKPIEVTPSVPAPSKEHTYIPGCWVYRDDHYVWRPGFWVECRPNWIWVPAHYVWSPCGYVFVEGYWDYTLKERGVLFAPVYLNAAVVCRPGYVYTPTYVVEDRCLYGALFVRPGCRVYYFGDYFGPTYVSAGYCSWVDVRVGCGDPLFTYYRWENRHDVQWEISLRATYTGRFNGTIAPPPRTLVVNNVTNVTNVTNVNNTVINNTVVNNTNINQKYNFTNNTVTTLNQAKQNGMKLQPVPQQERVAARAQAQQIVQASAKRSQAETHLLLQGPPPSKPGDKPRTAKLDVPRPPAGNPAAPGRTPPPALTKPAGSSGLTPPPGTHAPTTTPPGTHAPATTPPPHGNTPPGTGTKPTTPPGHTAPTPTRPGQPGHPNPNNKPPVKPTPPPHPQPPPPPPKQDDHKSDH